LFFYAVYYSDESHEKIREQEKAKIPTGWFRFGFIMYEMNFERNQFLYVYSRRYSTKYDCNGLSSW